MQLYLHIILPLDWTAEFHRNGSLNRLGIHLSLEVLYCWQLPSRPRHSKLFQGHIGSLSNPRVEQLREASLELALGQLSNITLGWKGLPGPNTLAYWLNIGNNIDSKNIFCKFNQHKLITVSSRTRLFKLATFNYLVYILSILIRNINCKLIMYMCCTK